MIRETVTMKQPDVMIILRPNLSDNRLQVKMIAALAAVIIVMARPICPSLRLSRLLPIKGNI